MPQTLPEIIEARNQLKTKLSQIGVTPEHYEEVLELLEQYQSADLFTARNSQFRDTAYEMLSKLSAITNKNTDKLSILLRMFAVHVAQNVIPASEGIEELVDEVPEMPREE